MTIPPRPRRRFLLSLTLLCWTWSVVGAAQASSSVYKTILPGTALISDPVSGTAGTGVLIDRQKRHLLTNQHVVGDALEVNVVFPAHEQGRLVTDREHYLNNLRPLQGRVIARDARRDLALIQLPSLPADARQVQLAATPAEPGATLHGVGNGPPLMWGYLRGTVRQRCRLRVSDDSGNTIDCTLLAAQLPVNPGDSGGPVVDDEGKLVGLISGFWPEKRDVSYAIDCAEIAAFLRQLPPASPLFGTWQGTYDEGKEVRTARAVFAADGSYRLIMTDKKGRLWNVLSGTYSLRNGMLTIRHGKVEETGAARWSVSGRDFTFAALKTRFRFRRGLLGLWQVYAGGKNTTAVVPQSQLIGRWEGTYKSGDSAKALGTSLVFAADGTYELTLTRADKTKAVLRGNYRMVNEVLTFQNKDDSKEMAATVWPEADTFSFTLGAQFTLKRKTSLPLAAKTD